MCARVLKPVPAKWSGAAVKATKQKINAASPSVRYMWTLALMAFVERVPS